jgi:hypothetical protein
MLKEMGLLKSSDAGGECCEATNALWANVFDERLRKGKKREERGRKGKS